ncbi:MAG: hypothetical protein M3255_09515 [Pseudomonadota bacterium]|nr:hypothetical protein [Pseudomonadota bacterium]
MALNTLSNGVAQRDVGQMVEAWMLALQTYGPWLKRMGRKFARIAVVDASLIKLSLLAYSWAEYRKQTGAANLTRWWQRLTSAKAHTRCSFVRGGEKWQ